MTSQASPKRRQLMWVSGLIALSGFALIFTNLALLNQSPNWQLALMLQLGWIFPILYLGAFIAVAKNQTRLGMWLMVIATSLVLPLMALFIPEFSPSFGLSIALFIVLGGSRYFSRNEILMVTAIAVLVTLATLVIGILDLPTHLENFAYTSAIQVFGTIFTIVLVVLTVIEVLRRATTEQKLATSESRLRMIAENSPDVFWLANPTESQIAYVSSGYKNLTGLSIESLYTDPRSWIQLLSPIDQRLLRRTPSQNAPVSRDRTEFETQITLPDNTQKWILVRSAPMLDQTGRVIARTGFMSDISRQKMDEARLKASQDQLKLTLDTLNDAVFVLDERGEFEEFYRPSGQSRFPLTERVLGRNYRDILPDDTAAEFERVIEFVGATEEPGHIIFSYQAKDEIQWFDAGVSPRPAIGGKSRGVTIIARDITKQVELEAVSQKWASELIEQNADLDAFAHTVAHDLKNALTKVYGYAELLVADLASPDGNPEAFAEQVLLTSRKMTDIIDALLLFSRVRKSEFVPQTVQMALVVDEALIQLSRLLQDTDAQITSPHEWPQVIGYPQWIESVWINYITNAVKYGGTPAKIELGFNSEANFVRFWVRDNGPGLESEQIDGLFIEWTRLDPGHEPGHGLGLSIVRRIVEKAGGQVGAESEPGSGSLFYFTLPATD